MLLGKGWIEFTVWQRKRQKGNMVEIDIERKYGKDRKGIQGRHEIGT